MSTKRKVKSKPEALLSLTADLQKKRQENESIEVEKSQLTENSIRGEIPYDESKQGIERGVVYVDIDMIEPAPIMWDFWSDLTEDDYNDLKMDIYLYGLDTPIKLWKRHGHEKYMIINGKHRWKIYKDLKQVDFEKYKKIPATIETEDTLSELDVRDRIIALNIKGRKKTPMDMVRASLELYKIYKERMKYGDGSPMKAAAEELGVSTKQFQRYLDCDNCIDEYQVMLDNYSLSINNGVRISKFSKEDQLWIYNTFTNKLQNKFLKQLVGTMTRDEVEKVFNPEKDKKVTINYSIPKHLRKEFDDYVRSWMIQKKLIEEKE